MNQLFVTFRTPKKAEFKIATHLLIATPQYIALSLGALAEGIMNHHEELEGSTLIDSGIEEYK